ncbi:MAG: Ig-like domain-containing protein, partial [Blastocatellia bacterium]
VRMPVYSYNGYEGKSLITGGFYTGTQFPDKYKGSLFFGDYDGKWIRRAILNANHEYVGVEEFATGVGDVVAVEPGPDGALYYILIESGELKRIRYSARPVARISASATTGASPLSVDFSGATSTDPNGAPLRYLWDFGDGTTATAAQVTHVFTTAQKQTFTVRLTVTNNQNISDTTTLDIIAGNRAPVAQILSPGPGTTVIPGQRVTFNGAGADLDEQLPTSSLSWQVLLHHDNHVHPYLTAIGSTGSFVAEDHGAGTYYFEIILTVTDSLGATSLTSVDVGLRTNAAPAIAITAPQNGASFNAPGEILLSANASDNDGTISKVEFFDGATLIGTATSAPFRLTWSNPAPGPHTLTARATDNQGLSATSAPVSISINANAPPTVTLTAPQNGASFNAPGEILLSANASDNDGTISKVEFFDGATLLGAATSAPFRLTWNNPAPGSHTLTARATDNQGLSATSAPVSISINANAPPTVTLTAPQNGAAFSAPASVTLAAQAADTDGTVARVEFYLDNALVNTDVSAPWEFTATSVGAGPHQAYARAVDNTGAATNSAVSNFTGSSLPPNPMKAAITSPGNGASYPGPTSVTLAATADETAGPVTRMEFYVNDTLVGSDTTFPWNVTVRSIQPGVYRVYARAVSFGSLTSISDTIRLTITGNEPLPNAPPAVSLTGPPAGAQFTAPANITLAAAASDTDGTVARVEFLANGQLIGAATQAPYTFVWNNVPAGSWQLTAVATDDQGAKTTSATVSVTVNSAGGGGPVNRPPTATITGPANGAAFTAPASVEITAGASDPDGSVQRVEFYSNGALLGTDTSAPYSFTAGNLAAGSYQLTARAIDNQGATGNSAAVAISVSDPPPPGGGGAAGPLPAPWQDSDIGSVGVSGVGTWSAGQFTLSGSGNSQQQNRDALYYVWVPLSGNAQITARIKSVSGASLVRAGLMIREKLSADARSASVTLSNGNETVFFRRLTTGALAKRTNGAPAAPAHWIRLTRSGNNLSAWQSADGVNWNFIGAETIALPFNAWIGLMVSAGDTYTTGTAVFDNVTIQ